MASGNYPLNRNYNAGVKLAAIADDLRALLKTRGDDQYSNPPYPCLPTVYEDNVPEDAARDGGFETYLELALELIDRCLTKPERQP